MILLWLLLKLSSCLNTKAKCNFDSITSICDSVTIYFYPNYPLRINSYITFNLPFKLYSEELSIESMDGSTVSSFTIQGSNSFQVLQTLQANLWYVANLTLNTVNAKSITGIGIFQMTIMASQYTNAVILEQGPQIPLKYSVTNQIYSASTSTPQSTITPASIGNSCSVSNWVTTIQKNTIHQQQQFQFTLSANTTNDRLDLVLTFDQIDSGLIFFRNCYVIGSQLIKQQTTCTLVQDSLTLTFQLRSSDPIILQETIQYTIYFYVGHQGETISVGTFTSQFLQNTQIIDQCSSSSTFSVDSTDPSSTDKIIQDVSTYIDTSSIGPPTFFSVTFKPKSLQFYTKIQIQLGYLQTDQLECKAYQLESTTFLPSIQFSYYEYDDDNLYFYINENKTDDTQYQYSINCTGMLILSTSDQIFKIIYSDIYDTIIQFFEVKQPPRLPTELSTSTSLSIIKKISIVEKLFNNPLVSSITTYTIIPTYGIYRVLIEYPYSYTINNIKCAINDTISYCKQDELNQNRIIAYVNKYYTSDLMKYQFNLTIYGVINPIDLPYNSRICVMLDDDDIIQPLLSGNTETLNGILEYQYIEDSIGNQFSYMSTSNFQFSQSLARTYNTYLYGNITLSMGSILIQNILYLQFSEQYYLYNLTCSLIKIGDSNNNNYISSCSSKNNYIKMILITDSSNQRFSQSYTLNISSFRTQDLISTDTYKNLQPLFQLFLSQDNQILLMEHQLNGTFFMKNNKIPFYWYSVDSSGTYTKLEVAPGFENIPTYKVFLNHFGSNRLYLGLSDVTSRFNCTINLAIPDINENIFVYGQSSKYTKQSFSSESVTLPKYIINSTNDEVNYETTQDSEITINPGDSGYRFNIASKNLLNVRIRVSINYTISFPDRNSWNPIYYYNPYSEIPIIYLEIINQECNLIPEYTNYKLPLNGYTHPILIDISECIPALNTKLNITIENNNKLNLIPIQISTSRQLFEIMKRTTIKSPQYYYIFQIETTDESIVDMTTIIYINTDTTINIVTVDEYTDTPTATSLIGTYSESSNSISLQMSCSQPAEILLIIGIDEISDSDFETLKTNNISSSLDTSYSLFKLNPQNASIQLESIYQKSYSIFPTTLIMDIYNNQIGNQITYYDYDIASEVNQSLITDSSYKVFMNSIRRMNINRMSLIDKTNQLYLQRIKAKMNYVSTQQTFLLSNLRYDTKYSFGYFCKNLNGISSDISTNFLYIANQTTKNNQTIGKLLQMKFKSTITTMQQNNILCALIQYFSLNQYQVLSKECKRCQFNKIHYDKINYTTYLQLVADFIPYENRSLTDQQKFLDNIYTMSIYLNSYPNSNGQDFNIETIIDQKMNLTNDTMLSIVNITDDLQLTYLYESFSYVNLTSTKRSDEDLQTQLIMTGYKFKTISIEVTVKANLDVLAIVGLHAIYPMFENVYKHPTGIMLRRGIMGTFNNITEGVQLVELSSGTNTTITFKNLVDGQKYFLYYSSTDLQNDCLTKQYQETVVQVITFKSEESSYLQIIYVTVFMSILI